MQGCEYGLVLWIIYGKVGTFPSELCESARYHGRLRKVAWSFDVHIMEVPYMSNVVPIMFMKPGKSFNEKMIYYKDQH